VGSIHTLFPRGAKIRIIMRDGSQMICKFIEKPNDRKIRTSKGVFEISNIRSADFYKPLKHEIENDEGNAGST
jgi:hypothetical protein